MTDIPSFMVKPGEVIKIKKTSEKNIYFRNSAEKLKKAERPSWLNFSADDLSVKILHEPQDTDLPLNLNIQVITEYYSK